MEVRAKESEEHDREVEAFDQEFSEQSDVQAAATHRTIVEVFAVEEFVEVRRGRDGTAEHTILSEERGTGSGRCSLGCPDRQSAMRCGRFGR